MVKWVDSMRCDDGTTGIRERRRRRGRSSHTCGFRTGAVVAIVLLTGRPTVVRSEDLVSSPIELPQVTLHTEVFEVEQVRDPSGRMERRLVPALDLVAGDELRYAIVVHNDSAARIEAGRVQVQTGIPATTRFLPGSAGGAGSLVEYAVEGATFSAHLPELAPEGTVVELTPAPVSSAAVSAEQVVTPHETAVPASLATAPIDPLAAVVPVAAEPLTLRWTYQQPLDPGAVAEVFFHVRLE